MCLKKRIAKEFDAGIDDELAKMKGAQILIITAQQKKKK